LFRLDSFLSGVTHRERVACGHPISKVRLVRVVWVKAKPLCPEGAPPSGMPSQLRRAGGKNTFDHASKSDTPAITISIVNT